MKDAVTKQLATHTGTRRHELRSGEIVLRACMLRVPMSAILCMYYVGARLLDLYLPIHRSRP